MQKEEGKTSFVPALIALGTGIALGMLLAPKKGSEMRDDLTDVLRRNREKALGLAAKIAWEIPRRFKIAAGVGAAKGVAVEALHEARDGVASALRG